MPRLRRFLHIERPREGRGEKDGAPSGASDRFGGVERPGAGPAAPSSSGAGLGRFGPEPDPRIDLVETEAGERPFTRCMRCGMDHNVFAVECSGCGASLDTEPQREFNERLWARRQEDAAREAKAAAERREAEARAEAELSAARRKMGEELAREVGDRERLRLGTEGRGWGGRGFGSFGGGGPIGLRILRALPDWRWQAGAIALAVALVSGLFAYGRRGHPFALLAALVLVAVLVVPPGWRIRRW